MALGDDFFVQTFTTTLQKYERQLVDNVLLEHPVLELFKSSAKSYTGRGLVIPVRAANLSSTGYTDASGTHATTVSGDILGSAVYSWADTIITPFRLKHNDILENSGPEQIVNLVEEYIKAASADHGDFIVAELHKLASAWTSGDLLSMDMLFAATDKLSSTTARTIGGIRGGEIGTISAVERTGGTATITVGAHDLIVGDVVVISNCTETAYNNGGSNPASWTVSAVAATTFSFTGAPAGTQGTTAATGTLRVDAVKEYWRATRLTRSGSENIIAGFRRTVNEVYRASRKRPTHVICGFAVYEALEAELQSKGQYTNPQGTAQTRFNEIKFGELTVRLDPDCQDFRAYFIHQPSLRFGYCAGEFMKAYPAQPLQGTLDTVVPMASRLVFGVAERRANGLYIWS
jgi:hypothetical protein